MIDIQNLYKNTEKDRAAFFTQQEKRKSCDSIRYIYQVL